uniref:HIT-type domain-containing protein n=1 Tax=Globodera pallida TaxID=36090 RepID=A0A183CBX4_GLOPA
MRQQNDDNFQEDPHVNLTWHKAAPKFDDEMVFGDKDIKKRKRKVGSPSKISGAEQATKKGKKIVAALTKTRFRKTFSQLLEEAKRKREEEVQQNKKKDVSPEFLLPTYSEVASFTSKMPPRKFCAVCGLSAAYTCVRCSARFCSIPCKGTHSDTRCLKWTV